MYLCAWSDEGFLSCWLNGSSVPIVCSSHWLVSSEVRDGSPNGGRVVELEQSGKQPTKPRIADEIDGPS